MSVVTAPFSPPILRVSEAARDFIVNARAEEDGGADLALFIEVNGTADGVYTYDMWFESPADAGPGDAVEENGELSVVITAKSADKMLGAILDLGDEGLFITNPNIPPVASVPSTINVPVSDLSKPVEQAVIYVLEHEINPQIAMHGGRADLVAVDDEGVAYLTLSGGCQGCGMASVTLSQGISVAIKDAVPEVLDIVDVTDHDLGDNPYFAGAKK
jgi:Fe/S biogenesis protein NfuA